MVMVLANLHRHPYKISAMKPSDALRSNREAMYNPPHPGEVLREYLPLGMSVTEVALRIGVPQRAVSKLFNGRAGVSAEMSYRLSTALRTSAEFWMGLQQAFDLWQVRQADLPKVRRLAA